MAFWDTAARAFWARAGRHMGGHTSVCQFHNWKSRASQLQCPATWTPHICAWFIWLEQPPTMFLGISFSLRPFDAILIWPFSIANSLTKFLTKTRIECERSSDYSNEQNRYLILQSKWPWCAHQAFQCHLPTPLSPLGSVTLFTPEGSIRSHY